jgi:ribosomal protein RSM22 (predicted rRNA methylase)
MFSKLSPEVCQALAGIPQGIEAVSPVPARFRKDLGKNIRDLSALLTADRQSLSGKYLGNPAFFSAYIRYFFPWNLFRLCKLFAGNTSLPALFADDRKPLVVTDFGSGPLTLPAALWIAFPELREKPVEFRCFDINRHILKTGEALFYHIAGNNGGKGSVKGKGSINSIKWKIKPVCSSLTTARAVHDSTLVSAVNVYNELFWKLRAADTGALDMFAAGEAARLASFCSEKGAVLLADPGIPRSGEFIARIRNCFIARGFSIEGPCTHTAPCPMQTSKTQNRAAKWCHFTFPVDEAPQSLQTLSVEARLPKEHGVLSFLLVKKGPDASGMPSEHNRKTMPVRVISGMFPLPASAGSAGCYARYGCSAKGLILLTGDRRETGGWHSGSLAAIPVTGVEKRDPKSGALIAPIGLCP